MNNIGRIFMDEAMEFVNPNKVDTLAKQIDQMWAEYADVKAREKMFDDLVFDAIMDHERHREYWELSDAYLDAAKEADAYFATINNKEETPSSVAEESFTPIPEDRLKRSARRKSDIRHKAKNAETLRRIYDKTKPDLEFNRRTDHAALDFKFFGRDIEDLVSKGKRLSEIGGVPKRKNYSKATRRDPDVPMHGSGYKKSENWKVK